MTPPRSSIRRIERCAAVAVLAIAGAVLAVGCGSSSKTSASTPVLTATVATTPRSTSTTTAPGHTRTTTPKKGTSSKAANGGPAKGRTGTATTATPPPPTTSAATKAKTATTKAAPVKTVPIAPARTKLGTPRTFSGDGDKTIGALTLKRSAVLHWTVAGGRFEIDALKVSGTGKTGQTFAAAGSYHMVKVVAKGHWKLTITPLGS